MITGLVILTGMLLVSGVLALVAVFLPSVPHLADTLGGLDNDPSTERTVAALGADPSKRSDRVGAWLYRNVPIPLTDGQRQNLQLRNQSIAEFYGDKAALAITGFVMPGLLGLGLQWIADVPVSLPILVALLGGLVGYFVPDLQLRGAAKATRSDAGEALLAYIDLVTLERLANASATQSLHNAANLSDVPLFVQIRAALERARLEQQAPFRELRRLADQLALPELTDLADVMQLDESGASLSGALRARLRELRDAHLTKAQVDANAASEGMTIYMTIPALIFGLIFIGPPLLRIALG